jgi:hypothetical protein
VSAVDLLGTSLFTLQFERTMQHGSLFTIKDKNYMSNSSFVHQEQVIFLPFLSVLSKKSLGWDGYYGGREEQIRRFHRDGFVEIKRSMNYHSEDHDEHKKS